MKEEERIKHDFLFSSFIPHAQFWVLKIFALFTVRLKGEKVVSATSKGCHKCNERVSSQTKTCSGR